MEPLDALHEAIVGWRATKHPRFAAIAEWATARALGPAGRPVIGASGKKADQVAWLELLEKGDVLDVPRLLAAIRTGKSATAIERLTLLARRDDPRVVTGVLAMLEAPPFRAQTALPFFRACAKVLAESGDRRVRGALEDLSHRYKGILETSVGDLVAALLRRTAEGLDEVKPGPLSAAHERQLAALEALFDAEQSATRRAEHSTRSAQQSVDALLSAIYAAPHDDAPRLVFADTLIERGDERGELINLQLARARGAATPEQRLRERELLRDQKRRSRWALPLSQGGECHLDRGFPDAMVLDPRTAKLITGEPALRLLHTVSGLERGRFALKTAKALLQGEHLVNVKTVKGLDLELFGALDGPLPWEEVSLRFLPNGGELSRFPKLRRLSVSPQTWDERLEFTAFRGAANLEWLNLSMRDCPAEEHLAPLTGLQHLELPRVIDEALAKALAVLPRLTSLRARVGATASSLAGLPLTRLTCHWEPGLDFPAVLGALPKLRELEVLSPSVQPRAMQQLFVDQSVRSLDVVTLGSFTFHRPFRDHGLLVVRVGNRMDLELQRLGEALVHVPAGCVARIVVRPHTDDPNHFILPPLEPQQLAQLTRGKLTAPLVQEWW